ncbi:MAG: VirB3 family type IV secretion system protein [Alphaproteobacteria bacterium]|nr:VirB3 family type IV secretion system protein [Alphaproteobacteria bacterium]
MAGRLQSDPLFQGLTRPTMILGVSYMYFVINAIVSMITFINLQSFKIILIVTPTVHLVGYLICLKEPRAIELFILKVNKGFRCLNRGFHGYTNSYDPF